MQLHAILAEFDFDESLTALLTTDIVVSFLSLYIVINPSGVASVFLALTRNSSVAERRSIAMRASIVGLIFLAVFAVGGTYIFMAVKITAATVQIAGGIFVFGLAFAMARGKEHEFFGHIDSPEASARRSVAYSPLAVPLIAGPASILVVMTTAAQQKSMLWMTVLLATIALVVFLAFLSMMRVLKLEKRFGAGIALIMPRLMGLLLAVIAIKFLIQGVAEILPKFAQAWQSGLEAAP